MHRNIVSGDFNNSLKSNPKGVFMWARDLEGICSGHVFSTFWWKSPGSKSTASSVSCKLTVPSAEVFSALLKNDNTSGMRRYGTVRYCNSSSTLRALRDLSKSGNQPMESFNKRNREEFSNENEKQKTRNYINNLI